eukprot:scaffold163010_cov66-Attheya_sp.AAC.1
MVLFVSFRLVLACSNAGRRFGIRCLLPELSPFCAESIELISIGMCSIIDASRPCGSNAGRFRRLQSEITLQRYPLFHPECIEFISLIGMGSSVDAAYVPAVRTLVVFFQFGGLVVEIIIIYA